MKFAVVALAAGLIAGTAYADDANKHSCQQPPIPGRMASDLVMKSFSKRSETYKKCISDFVAERRTFVDANSKTNVPAAQAAHDAAEAAIVEYNDYIKQLNERNAAANGDDDDNNK